MSPPGYQPLILNLLPLFELFGNYFIYTLDIE
jgi:hypothetical protein